MLEVDPVKIRLPFVLIIVPPVPLSIRELPDLLRIRVPPVSPRLSEPPGPLTVPPVPVRLPSISLRERLLPEPLRTRNASVPLRVNVQLRLVS